MKRRWHAPAVLHLVAVAQVEKVVLPQGALGLERGGVLNDPMISLPSRSQRTSCAPFLSVTSALDATVVPINCPIWRSFDSTPLAIGAIDHPVP